MYEWMSCYLSYILNKSELEVADREWGRCLPDNGIAGMKVSEMPERRLANFEAMP